MSTRPTHLRGPNYVPQVPLFANDLHPMHLIHGSCAQPNVKRHLDRFSCYVRLSFLRLIDTRTNRQTHRSRNIANNRRHSYALRHGPRYQLQSWLDQLLYWLIDWTPASVWRSVTECKTACCVWLRWRFRTTAENCCRLCPTGKDRSWRPVTCALGTSPMICHSVVNQCPRTLILA